MKKAIYTVGIIAMLISPIFAQQFQLEVTLDKEIGNAILDIDGDGVCEYIADTNKVYDGATHNLKYTLPSGSIHWNEPETAQNPYSVFPHIDFNGDGKRELIMYSSGAIIVYDLFNSEILFEFDPPEESVNLSDLIDIDGDGELELVLSGSTYNYPDPSIYKTYIYSTGVTTSVLEEAYSISPKGYQLEQNFPNPFNPSTTIRYSIKTPDNISIKIYDVSGQLVSEIFREYNQAGVYEVVWDGTNEYGNKVSSGIYFYQLVGGNFSTAKKMILL